MGYLPVDRDCCVDPATSQTEVSERNHQVTGTDPSPQATSPAPAIAAVDELLTDGEGDPDVLVEGHPEVCCQAVAATAIEFSNHAAVGSFERQVALRQSEAYGHGDRTGLVCPLEGHDHVGRVGRDDLFDAMALALTAVAPADERRRRPDDAHRLMTGDSRYRWCTDRSRREASEWTESHGRRPAGQSRGRRTVTCVRTDRAVSGLVARSCSPPNYGRH